MWPTEFRSKRMSQNGWGSNILHTAQTYQHVYFHVFGKLMKVLKGIHIGSQCVGGWGSGLGSGSRHSLQMGYTNLRINGTPV